MKALATMVRWDAVLNVRQGIVYAALWVMLLWSALLSLVPEAVRVPALISLLFLEISIFALYLLPGFYYLEKGERVLDSQAVAPIPAGFWLLSKTLVFALQIWAVATAITLIAHGPDVRWGWFFAAIAWAGLPLLWLGFACAARYDGISAYLFPSVPLLLGLQAPLLSYWGIWPGAWGWIFPTMPGLALLEAAFAGGDPARPVLALGLGALYALPCFWLAWKSFQARVIRPAGA